MASSSASSGSALTRWRMAAVRACSCGVIDTPSGRSRLVAALRAASISFGSPSSSARRRRLAAASSDALAETVRAPGRLPIWIAVPRGAGIAGGGKVPGRPAFALCYIHF